MVQKCVWISLKIMSQCLKFEWFWKYASCYLYTMLFINLCVLGFMRLMRFLPLVKAFDYLSDLGIGCLFTLKKKTEKTLTSQCTVILS